MSGEAWATLAGTVLGAILGYGLTWLQRYIDETRKLRAYATVLLTELIEIDLKVIETAPGELRPLLDVEFWKSSRLEVVTLLNNPKLVKTLSVIDHFVDEWNSSRTVQYDDWYKTRDDLSKHLDVAIRQLERISKMAPPA